MKATWNCEVSRRELVPSEGRAAWLDKHGVPVEETVVTCEAELADWEAAGWRIGEDGSVREESDWLDGTHVGHGRELTASVVERLRANPTDISTFDATKVLHEQARVRADALQRIATKEAAQEAEKVEALRVAAEVAALSDDDVITPDGTWKVDGRLREAILSGGLATGEASARASALRREQRERADAAKKKAEAALDDACRAWATNADSLPDEVVRAAKEGRNVRGRVIALVRDRCMAWLKSAIPDETEGCIPTVNDGGRGFSFELAPERVPTPMAYQIRDAIASSVDSLAVAAMLPGVEVEVSDFGRIDVSPTRHESWRGGFEVLFSHPWLKDGGFELHVLTEPENVPESDED